MPRELNHGGTDPSGRADDEDALPGLETDLLEQAQMLAAVKREPERAGMARGDFSIGLRMGWRRQRTQDKLERS